MKKFIYSLMAVCFCVTTAFSQVDLKINPIGALFNSPDLAGEYLVNDNLGVELSVGLVYGDQLGSGLLTGLGGEDFSLKRSGYRVRLSGKYYFSPEQGCDRFYAGFYLGPRSTKFSANDPDVWGTNPNYKNSAFTAGLIVGFKWVGDSGVLFEVALGGGRAFGNNLTFEDETGTETVEGFGFDGVGVLAVGYRIGEIGGGSKKKKKRR